MASGTTSPHGELTSRKRFKLQQVSTLAGLALAMLLTVTVAKSESADQSTSSMGEPASAALVPLQPGAHSNPEVVYYLVSSQEEADQVRSWVWYEHALLRDEPGYRRTTYVPIITNCDESLSSLKTSLDVATSTRVASRRLVFLTDQCRP